MRQLITEKDVNNIVGRWVVEIDNTLERENFKLTESKNDGFWLEKRISFVGTIYSIDGAPHIKLERKKSFIIMNGIYYTHGVYTPEEFVEYFNNGYKSKKERFCRLLTNKELDWLNERLKNRSL